MVGRTLGEADAGTPGAWSPSADVVETEAGFEIKAEVPGVRREDLELKLSGAKLDLRGVRRPPGDEANYHRLEGRYGAFRRIFVFEGEIDESSVVASLERGILSVRLERKGPVRRQVPVDWRVGDG